MQIFNDAFTSPRSWHNTQHIQLGVGWVMGSMLATQTESQVKTFKVVPTAAMSDVGSMSGENALNTNRRNSTGMGLITRTRCVDLVTCCGQDGYKLKTKKCIGQRCIQERDLSVIAAENITFCKIILSKNMYVGSLSLFLASYIH